MTYRDSLLNPMMYVRLITHIFGHLGWDHFFGNMSYILLLGPMVEEKYGSDKLIVKIFATALITGILNNVLFPNVALCGASGIVFMLIVLSSVTSVKSGKLPLTLVLVLIIYLGAEVYNAIMVTDSISQFTHIIGGICGSIFGLLLIKQEITVKIKLNAKIPPCERVIILTPLTRSFLLILRKSNFSL